MVSIERCFREGWENLRENFWPYALIVVILGIVDSFGNGRVIWQGRAEAGMHFPWDDPTTGLLAFVIGVFVKPVFDFGARLQFVRGNRGEEPDVREIVEGFNSKDFYIDIILTNLMVTVLIIGGVICLVLPGIYIACRTVLTSYLVMDKGLAPKQALKASWELMRGHWFSVIALGLLSFCMLLFGLILFIVGIIPALVWAKAAFAAFYQQIIDAHDEDFLRSLDIEP